MTASTNRDTASGNGSGSGAGLKTGVTFDEAFRLLRAATPVEERWIHVLGVTQTAMQLASCHGVDLERASWAALLHDCAKCMGRDALEARLRGDNLLLEPDDLLYPAVWHALVGADEVRRVYGIDDPSILTAIRDHPTGGDAMDDVSLVLFVADYTEPNREYDASKALRVKAFHQPLLQTAREICAEKIEHLHRKGRGVHARSTRALAELTKRTS